MLMLLMNLMFISILSMVVMMAAVILSKKTFSDREKSSPFECGFDPKNSARMPFSLRFFLIAIIFLIFDVEITLLLPLPIILTFSQSIWTFITSSIFIIILILGLYYEWIKGALEWKS
uniref:NADH dehydrogenase subunit 3 n=1 Tax=Thereuopoda clunifera TaxID=60460 RepID=UPI0022FDA959|nr:NADH dehydrogenase subunit 3 [Thereuopoda clunifera]WAP91278.1 NADH dehydrogenase subunit 3 [Thereuopoda clunifera]